MGRFANNTSVEELQAEMEAWLDHNFPDEDPVLTALGLMEEVGEVARCLVKRRQLIRGTIAEWNTELEKELGDVFIKLVHLCVVEGLDLAEVVLCRWAVIRERDMIADRLGHGLPEDA